MDEFQKRQSDHLKRLKEEQGIRSWKALADRIGVTSVTVSRWVNGKAIIRPSNAETISREFPDYSKEYILGYSDYPNGKAQLIAENWARIREHDSIGAAIGALIVHAGFEFTGFKDFQPDVEGFELHQLTRLDDGAALEIPKGQLDDFYNEVCAYVEMRLNLMFEKGCR